MSIELEFKIIELESQLRSKCVQVSSLINAVIEIEQYLEEDDIDKALELIKQMRGIDE